MSRCECVFTYNFLHSCLFLKITDQVISLQGILTVFMRSLAFEVVHYLLVECEMLVSMSLYMIGRQLILRVIDITSDHRKLDECC